MNKIRVLQIAVHLGGGAGKAIAGMIRQTMDWMDYEVILLEAPKSPVYVEMLKGIGIPTTINDDAANIAERISENDVTVVNWWGRPLTIRLLVELPLINGRIVIWNHINGCSYPYLKGEFLDCFDRILFTSPYSESNSLWDSEQRKKILEKSDVAYGMGDFCPAAIRLKKDFFEHGQIVIGYAGTLNYAKLNRKWLDYYRKAVENFENVKILMLGEPSEEVLADAEKSGIKEYIRFTGYVSDVYKYYLKMDVFAYFLSSENYATTENAMIEAMSSGLPVIALDNSVEAYIIENYKNGILIHSPDEFVERVRWLMKDNNAEKLGKNAREYSIRKYSAEANAEIFRKACKAVSEVEQHPICFRDGIGEEPFDMLCMQAGKERVLFQKIRDGGDVSEAEIKGIPYIYRETGKASIHQFLKYFPGNKDLKFLEEYINRYENR